MRPVLKELSLEAYDDVSILNSVAAHLDSIDFKKVKTKYTKGEDWTALSLHGYGPEPLDILKPGWYAWVNEYDLTKSNLSLVYPVINKDGVK